ncbi:inorganic diphosphatase [Candidatus Woesebacteria bacterium]|nr:inorganic diphosphatase [Candidatus Woesebacteria bacterium]
MNLSKLSIGKNAPEELNVVIEISQGGYIKYELDKESGMIVVDRFSYSSMAYPFNYGFVPHTHAEDGDPLDVQILCSRTLSPGVVIPVRVIGMLEMEDEAGVDTKIVAVPTKKVDPFYAHVEDIDDIDEHTKNKIKHFYEHYKDLEPGKWVKLNNFLPKKDALEAVKKAMK